MHRHPTGQTGHPGTPRCTHSGRIVALSPAVSQPGPAVSQASMTVSQLQCRSSLSALRLPRAPAARPAHACSLLRPAPARPLTPARPLAPAPSAPAPAHHIVVVAPGRVAGPSTVSQRAPGSIVDGNARQACAQPAQPTALQYSWAVAQPTFSALKFFFFLYNIFVFIISNSWKNHKNHFFFIIYQINL